jgi:hypothetical protein
MNKEKLYWQYEVLLEKISRFYALHQLSDCKGEDYEALREVSNQLLEMQKELKEGKNEQKSNRNITRLY